MSIALSINISALGDTLAAIPTLNKLAKTHGSTLTVFSYHPYLFENHPSVKETLPINSSKENALVFSNNSEAPSNSFNEIFVFLDEMQNL